MKPVAAPPDPETERAQLETLWEHIPIGVVLVDAGSGRILRTNPRVQVLLGEQLNAVASGEFGVHGGCRVVYPDGRSVLPDDWALARTIATGERVVDEVVEFEFDGSARRTFSITSIPVEERGRLVAVLGLFDEVTEQERRGRIARDFLTNAAHELQTPLAAITSAIDVLQAGAKDRVEERDRFLLHIEQSVGRLGRLARALLVLSRAQAQLEPPRTELIELEPFLRGIADAMPRAIDVRCDPKIAVVANRSLLEQAVTNLVDNALKHAGDGISLAGDFADGRATILVRDSGRGIPVTDQPLVFERFFRTGNRSGFGLGLAIVREVVEVLGGELRLDSDASGTRVSIVLNGALVRKK